MLSFAIMFVKRRVSFKKCFFESKTKNSGFIIALR